jgi:hypothetical protein
MVPLAEGVAEDLPEPPEPPELLELLEELLPEAVTCMENAGSAVALAPSLAEITMLAYLPAFGPLGVPESSPVVRPNIAQMGLFWILKLSGLLAGLVTVGRKR